MARGEPRVVGCVTESSAGTSHVVGATECLYSEIPVGLERDTGAAHANARSRSAVASF